VPRLRRRIALSTSLLALFEYLRFASAISHSRKKSCGELHLLCHTCLNSYE
jgi:hypothetical protein